MLATESLAPDMATLAKEIVSNGVDEAEVLRLRREVFKDGVVGRDEADLLFWLNDNSNSGNDTAWYEFFVEALTDYFVWKQEPRGYLNDADSAYLVDRVNRDGKIDGATEFGLVLNVLHHLRVAPENVVLVALQGVKDTVLGGAGPLFGPNRRRKGIIDPPDVDVIRAVVFAAGGDGSLTISQREAELLFELNNAAAAKKNAPEWQTLFVQAVGHYLMYPDGAPAVPDRAEATRREKWLEQRRGTGNVMKGMLRSLNRRVLMATMADMMDGNDEDGAAAQIAKAEAFARESIDQPEAAWLLDRIDADGVLHDNEKALLAFIKKTSPQIHPSLDPLFERAGLR